jgi:hypothetical protein
LSAWKGDLFDSFLGLGFIKLPPICLGG